MARARAARTSRQKKNAELVIRTRSHGEKKRSLTPTKPRCACLRTPSCRNMRWREKNEARPDARNAGEQWQRRLSSAGARRREEKTYRGIRAENSLHQLPAGTTTFNPLPPSRVSDPYTPLVFKGLPVFCPNCGRTRYSNPSSFTTVVGASPSLLGLLSIDLPSPPPAASTEPSTGLSCSAAPAAPSASPPPRSSAPATAAPAAVAALLPFHPSCCRRPSLLRQITSVASAPKTCPMAASISGRYASTQTAEEETPTTPANTSTTRPLKRSPSPLTNLFREERERERER